MEAGVLRKVGEGMNKSNEVSTASWSGKNTEYLPQKGLWDPVDSNRAL